MAGTSLFRKIIPVNDVLPMMALMCGAMSMVGYTLYNTAANDPDNLLWDRSRRRGDFLAEDEKLTKECLQYHKTPFRRFAEWAAHYRPNYYEYYSKLPP